MDLFGSISSGHAGSSVSMSSKNPRLIRCVMCAQTIQACLHRVVETLPAVHPGVGRACLPASLFSRAQCLCHWEVGFPQGEVEIASVLRLPIVISLLAQLQGFPTVCSFFLVLLILLLSRTGRSFRSYLSSLFQSMLL